MVNVELIHNPYLRETQIRFNGREPRVNSAIEKYFDKKLVDWVNEVPQILRSEMNGYDFELIFSGTDADFNALAEAFSDAGVGEDQVRLVRKATLGNVREKQVGIAKLLTWLETHQNRKFKYMEFLDKNPAITDNAFPLIVLHGAEISAPDDFTIEEVDSIEDLDNTNLLCTPIVYHCNRTSVPAVRKDVAWLLSRKDVMLKQLFFVCSDIQKKNAMRTLSDLGIKNPRPIKDANDEAVVKYIESYPLTEYVRYAIEAFDGCVECISLELEEENEIGAQSSAGGRAKIVKIDEELTRLKEAQEHFAHLDLLEEPKEFWVINTRLKESLLGWKSRKTKIIGEQEVMNWANDYEAFACQSYSACFNEISNVISKMRTQMESAHAAAYKEAGVDQEYRPAIKEADVSITGSVPDVKQVMLNLMSVSYEEPRNDFFGFFNVVEPDENGLIKVTSCYLDQWREAVADLLIPVAQKVENEAMNLLRFRYEQLGRDYKKHLNDLIEQKKEAKEKLTSRLTEYERALQIDNDWLSEFKGQLQEIKRG